VAFWLPGSRLEEYERARDEIHAIKEKIDADKAKKTQRPQARRARPK
jgi:hypothetical protein